MFHTDDQYGPFQVYNSIIPSYMAYLTVVCQAEGSSHEINGVEEVGKPIY